MHAVLPPHPTLAPPLSTLFSSTSLLYRGLQWYLHIYSMMCWCNQRVCNDLSRTQKGLRKFEHTDIFLKNILVESIIIQ
ncbi:uncharacterized protein LOC115697596 isoform X2 [Cannabis sativa]|uniref:uncharacterized protein LOC115697596 isoform X2 n=1 Tax=Cannabis sativa TaxID=3483 RepID=UPI0029CA5A2C|nr:uncharacterized protein LOC115697596 isoform X2 [Cannabis sativa]